MGYQIIHAEQEAIITIDGVKVRVSTGTPVPGTAFALGTVYEDRRGFTPVALYWFQAISDTTADSLKKLAAFFFASLLDTGWYIVEIPRDSALYPEEAKRIFGTYDHERAV